MSSSIKDPIISATLPAIFIDLNDTPTIAASPAVGAMVAGDTAALKDAALYGHRVRAELATWPTGKSSMGHVCDIIDNMTGDARLMSVSEAVAINNLGWEAIDEMAAEAAAEPHRLAIAMVYDASFVEELKSDHSIAWMHEILLGVMEARARETAERV